MVPQPHGGLTVVALKDIYSLHFGVEVSHVLCGDCPWVAEHTGQVGRKGSKPHFGWPVGHIPHSPHPTPFVFHEVEAVEQGECLQEVPEVNGETVPH
jgi:hypothetical protein